MAHDASKPDGSLRMRASLCSPAYFQTEMKPWPEVQKEVKKLRGKRKPARKAARPVSAVWPDADAPPDDAFTVYLAVLEETGIAADARKASGVTCRQVLAKRQNDPGFHMECLRVDAVLVEMADEELFRRSVGFPVPPGRDPYADKHSSTCLITFLKAHKKELYGDAEARRSAERKAALAETRHRASELGTPEDLERNLARFRETVAQREKDVEWQGRQPS
jgi:hypothetical protein